MIATSDRPAAVIDLRLPAVEGRTDRNASKLRSFYVTLARIPLALGGLAAIIFGAKELAITSFVVFAIVDVFDGVVARQDGSDNVRRRALDVVIDRAAIHAASLTCAATYDSSLALVVALMLRDIAQGGYCLFLLRRGLVVIGPKWHMAYSLLFLVWGGVFITAGAPDATLSVALAVVSIATMLDYIRITFSMRQ